jgi:hypothetical protein
MGANYGPTSQLRAKKIKWATLASFGGQLRPLLWASLASFNFILFYFILLLLFFFTILSPSSFSLLFFLILQIHCSLSQVQVTLYILLVMGQIWLEERTAAEKSNQNANGGGDGRGRDRR